MTGTARLGTPHGMTPPPSLVLASGSPRRRALLDEAGIRFEIQRPDVAEEQAPGESPEAFARRLAQAKAVAVARRVGPVSCTLARKCRCRLYSLVGVSKKIDVLGPKMWLVSRRWRQPLSMG